MLTKKDIAKRSLYVSITALIVCIIGYQYIDGPLVLWLNNHHSKQWGIFSIITQLANYITFFPHYLFTPFGIYILIRGVFGTPTCFEKKLFLLLIIILLGYDGIISNYFRSILGREWPSTWGNHVLSFITTNSSSFHFRIHNRIYGSFPSGHALLSATVGTFVWHYWPKLRYYFLVFTIYICFSMVINYYHYFSDVISGAAIGYLI